ncbi:hypothetical protein NDI52_33155 [Leptolyngbya sp. PL-A3]|uniref:hypothetical protein n=1 Tax=Leptolyngbya sp. PL-A3 TaxID=2933911 RepID=UPI003297A08D
MPQPVFDPQGLVHVNFLRLPGAEEKIAYASLQEQINSHSPESVNFGLARVPVIGELLQLDRFLWAVDQVIHNPVPVEEDPDDLFPEIPARVATLHIRFHGVMD